MVSEPNFVLGIKQTSLTSKEDNHVHTIIRSHTCLPAGSRLHDILQPPWLYVVSKSNKPSKLWLNIRSVKSKPRLTKPTPQTCSTTSRNQNPEIWSPKALPRATTRLNCLRKISHAPPQIPHFQIVFLVHAPPWRPPRPPIYRSWDSGPHQTLHAPSHASRISGISCTRRWTTRTRHSRAEKLRQLNMTSSLDTSTKTTSALDTSTGHVSSVASSAPRHLADRWPGPTRPEHSDLTREHWPLTLILDQLTLTFCVDLWPKVKISDKAYLAQFFA